MKTLLASLLTAALSLGISGCGSSSGSQSVLGINDIGVISLDKNSESAETPDFEATLRFNEPIYLDICFWLEDASHEARIINADGETVLGIFSHESTYDCATDEIAPLELDAGNYTLQLWHDGESNLSLIGIAFAKLPLENASSAAARAFPTSVDSQITDSVTQANVKVLGDAPAMSMDNLFQATAQALGNAAHNATTAQQQSNVTAQAATTMGVATLYSLDTASTGVATGQILQ